MKRLLSYPLSVVYYLMFGVVLVLFHPIQWFCFNVFGYRTHKKSVDAMNWFLLRCLNIIGTRFQFDNNYKWRKDVPHIIVANHQSAYDISPIDWFTRSIHPKFISKKELGKGIPSVSYNLKHGGSILIDRKNPRQSLPEFKRFAQYLNRTKRSAVIFPEGTRSKDGNPRKFSISGMKTLFKLCPEAVVVPVTINNSWKLQKNGLFPLSLGVKMRLQAHEPLVVSDFSTQELIEKVEQTITAAVKIR